MVDRKPACVRHKFEVFGGSALTISLLSKRVGASHVVADRPPVDIGTRAQTVATLFMDWHNWVVHWANYPGYPQTRLLPVGSEGAAVAEGIKRLLNQSSLFSLDRSRVTVGLPPFLNLMPLASKQAIRLSSVSGRKDVLPASKL